MVTMDFESFKDKAALEKAAAHDGTGNTARARRSSCPKEGPPASNGALCHEAVIARSVSSEAIQGQYAVNKLWIASPASRDAGSQ
jgi:hypothetical protein